MTVEIITTGQSGRWSFDGSQQELIEAMKWPYPISVKPDGYTGDYTGWHILPEHIVAFREDE